MCLRILLYKQYQVRFLTAVVQWCCCFVPFASTNGRDSARFVATYCMNPLAAAQALCGLNIRRSITHSRGQALKKSVRARERMMLRRCGSTGYVDGTRFIGKLAFSLTKNNKSPGINNRGPSNYYQICPLLPPHPFGCSGLTSQSMSRSQCWP